MATLPRLLLIPNYRSHFTTTNLFLPIQTAAATARSFFLSFFLSFFFLYIYIYIYIYIYVCCSSGLSYFFFFCRWEGIRPRWMEEEKRANRNVFFFFTSFSFSSNHHHCYQTTTPPPVPPISQRHLSWTELRMRIKERMVECVCVWVGEFDGGHTNTRYDVTSCFFFFFS